MKKNYFTLSCAFILGATVFAQTNLAINGNFDTGAGWIAQPAAACGSGASSISFVDGTTHTADGSGSFNLNCQNANNRLRTSVANKIVAPAPGTYTLKMWVQKTAADDGKLRVYLNPSNDKIFTVEGDFDVTSTDWTEVTRTFNIAAAGSYFLSFESFEASGTNGFNIDDVVLTEDAEVLSTENITKEDSNVSIITSVNQITVKTKTQIAKLEVYNVVGQNVLSQIGDSSTLSTALLSTNLYILKVYGVDGGISTKKFVKK
jgi:hypothetical protein